MKMKYILLKVPAGSPAPAGYTFARALPRQGLDVYQKEIPQAPAVQKQQIDELAAMMAGMGLGQNAAAVVEAEEGEAGLVAAMERLGLQGGRKKRQTRRARRRHHKRRATRQRKFVRRR